MRQCPQCFRVYANEASFCLEDGTPLTDTRDSEATQVRTAYLSTPTYATALVKKKSRAVLWLAIILAAACLAVGGVMLGLYLKTENNSTTTSTATPLPAQTIPPPYSTPTSERTRRPRSTPAPEPTSYPTYTPASPPVSVPIAPSEYVQLTPNQYKWFPFSIGSTGGSIQGEVAAQGGIGNDVLIYVIAESELPAFRGGYPFRRFYESGKVKSISINNDLPPGSYYLILKSPTSFTDRRIRCAVRAVSN